MSIGSALPLNFINKVCNRPDMPYIQPLFFRVFQVVLITFLFGSFGSIMAHYCGAQWLSFTTIGTGIGIAGVVGIISTRYLQRQYENTNKKVFELAQKEWQNLNDTERNLYS